MQIRKKYSLADRVAKESLVHQYLAEQDSVRHLITDFPSIEAFESIIQQRNFSSNTRQILSDELSAQYEGVGASAVVHQNIASLKEHHTFTITTGHQLCLATGPLFFLYKVASVIKLCQQLNVKYPNNHFVPIYWMASEDHDFEEINHIHLFGKKIEWDIEAKGAVGRLTLDQGNDWLSEIQSVIGDGDSVKDKINSTLEKAYSLKTLSDATRYLVNELFGDYGLVILDADKKALKSVFKPVLEKEIQEEFSFKAVQDTIKDWKVTPQVTPRECNLFYLRDGYRVRLEKKDHSWGTIDNEFTWSEEDLLQEVDQHPERFSPNVVLRPIYQEVILPNLAYIGGPGETAYWLELKGAFDAVEVNFPLLVFRDTMMLINHSISKKMQQFDWSEDDLFRPVDELIKEELEKNPLNVDINYLKEKWEEDIKEVEGLTEPIDSNLKKSLMGEWTKIQKSIDNMNQKITKGIKRKEEGTVKQIEGVKFKLFPNDIPQERYENFIQFYLSYQGDFVGDLIEIADPLAHQYKIVEV